MFVETEARPVGEPAKVGTLKLSEAMRIGARDTKQCSGVWWDGQGSFCALGAAYKGMGGDLSNAYGPSTLRERFGLSHSMFADIAHRNDSGESRESIADWLESQGL